MLPAVAAPSKPRIYCLPAVAATKALAAAVFVEGANWLRKLKPNSITAPAGHVI